MESGASEGEKGMNTHPLRTTNLLVAGLVLSALAILLGAGLLLIGIGFLVGSPMDDWVMYTFLWGVGLGLALLVPGIVGVKACIRRIRGKVEAADLRRRLGASLTAVGLLVALIGQLGFLPLGFEMGVLALVIGLSLVWSAGPTRVPAEAQAAEEAEPVDADAVHE
jgi:hypothetical protein